MDSSVQLTTPSGQNRCQEGALGPTSPFRETQSSRFVDPGDDWRMLWGTLPPFWAKARVTLGGGHSWQLETSEGHDRVTEKG